MDASTRIAVRAALRQNYLFAKLTDQELDALSDQIWFEQIPAGSLIVCEGDDADALYTVVSGGVNVQKQSGQFLSFLGSGGFFGEMALFIDGAKRSADCKTTADTVCAVVRKEVLHRFCDGHPEAGLKIYRAIIATLSERLTATSADLAALMSTQVKSQSHVSNLVEKAKRNRKA